MGARSDAVVIELSAAAKAAKAIPPNAYTQYMPTRPGFDANALSAAVTSPDAEYLSKGKTLAQVGVAARASMDERYAAMAQSGKPFDYNSFEGRDWYTLMGGLDRRALSAVSTNEGGQFTQQEQEIARTIMDQQQGLAMGLYNGPTSLAGTFRDPFAGDHAKRFNAAVKWLDRVGNDEKKTLTWAYSRASAQISYEWVTEGREREDLTSKDPLVQLIASAMRTMQQDFSRGWTTGSVTDAASLKQQTWFQGFESKLDAILRG
jgi:hypothetical protein